MNEKWEAQMTMVQTY